ncbi:MAG: nucleotide exchange factor GrpE [Sciscionella sp.]
MTGHTNADLPGDPPEVEEPVVIRDRRKVDQDTGELRTPLHEEGALDVDAQVIDAEAEGAAADDTAKLRHELAERTADLQRVQAEYANYRKRVERDRQAAAESAKASIAGELLTVLDDIERAETHGDLTGPFKAVAEKLRGVVTRSGVEAFAAQGEPFDPNVHEAVQHETSSEVSGPTVTAVLRRGYRIGERVIRAALVTVTDYAEPAAPAAESEAPVGEEATDTAAADSSSAGGAQR